MTTSCSRLDNCWNESQLLSDKEKSILIKRLQQSMLCAHQSCDSDNDFIDRISGAWTDESFADADDMVKMLRNSRHFNRLSANMFLD